MQFRQLIPGDAFKGSDGGYYLKTTAVVKPGESGKGAEFNAVNLRTGTHKWFDTSADAGMLDSELWERTLKGAK